MHVLDWLDGGTFIPSINAMLRPTELFVPRSGKRMPTVRARSALGGGDTRLACRRAGTGGKAAVEAAARLGSAPARITRLISN